VDAVLRIQVRVAARQARAALDAVAAGVRSVEKSMASTSSSTKGASAMAGSLRRVGTEIDKINRSLKTMGTVADAPFSKLDSKASSAARRMHELNKNLERMKSAGVTSSAMTPGASSKWSPEIAAAQKAKAERQIAKEAAAAQKALDAEARAQAKAQQDYMSQVWKQQVRDARAAAAAKRQADREAATAQKALDAQAKAQAKAQQDYLKSVWRQQVRDARQAAAAQRSVDADLKAQAKAQQDYMKSIWRQQVRDARQAATDLKNEEKRQAQFLKQAWKDMQSAAKQHQAKLAEIEKAGNAELAAVERERVTQAKSLQRQLAAVNKKLYDVGVRRDAGDKNAMLPYLEEKLAAEKRVLLAKETVAELDAAYKKGVINEKVAAELAQANGINRVVDAAAAAAKLVQIEHARIEATKAVVAEETALRTAEVNMMKAKFEQMAMVQSQAAARQAKAVPKVGMWERMSLAINGNIGSTRKGMIAFGKDLQWVGRQLNFNFTLPIVAATVAIGKFYLENQRAFTRLKKVYGDGTRDYTDELKKVEKAMRALSDMYGIQQKDVIALGASWAAAGATGAELANSVNNTLRLAVLGDYEDIQAAFQDLITIQGAYRLSSEQTATAVAMLNTAENMSAATMQDFTKAMALAGGIASSSGVSVGELAAMVAALVPTTGSAANAGNALKTIFSNMISPTAKLVETLRAVGIEFYGQQFQAMTVAQRLQFVADRMNTLTDGQRTYLASVAAGDRQINRFITLMDQMRDATSKYNEVLLALDPSRATQNLNAANKEIRTLLESDPKKFEIVVTQIKNMLTDAIIPLLPAISYMLTLVREAALWFDGLSDSTKKYIAIGLVAIVSIGVLSQFLGSVVLLVGQLARAWIWAGKYLFGATGIIKGLIGGIGRLLGILRVVPVVAEGAAAATATAISWPAVAVAAAIAAAIGLVYLFRDKLQGVFKWIGELLYKVWNLLPAGLQSALTKVWNMLKAAVGWIANLFSKLNPFDNPAKAPKRGADLNPDRIDPITAAQAAADPKTIATASDAAAVASDAAAIASTPDANQIAAYEKQASALQAQMDALKPSINAQEAVTNKAEAAYKAASRAADKFDKSLEPLREEVDRLKTAIDKANDKINELANTPITGMKAMSDAIFENEMAQKRLRLELLRMKQAGQGFEDIQKKMASLNGDIEMLQGKITDLRQAGAGSDILKVYEAELKSLQKQKEGLYVQADAVQALEDQLASLEEQGQILDLEQSLNFDGLLRQIDDLANGVKEMSFDDIVKGIREQKDEVAKLTPVYEAANTELAAQELILKGLQDEADRLNEIYDTENEKLQVLKDAYAVLEDQLQEVKAAKEALAGGDLPGGGDFADLTGNFQTPDLASVFGEGGDLDTLIQEWTDKSSAMFDGIDLFKPFRDGWEKFKTWWNDNPVKWWDGLKGWFSETWNGLFGGEGLDASGAVSSISGFFQDIIGPVVEYLQPLMDNISEIWGTLTENLPSIWESIKSFFGNIWEGLSSLVDPIGEFIQALGTIAGVILAVVRPVLIVLWTVLSNIWEFIMNALSPVIEGLGEVFKGVFEVIGGVIGFISALINGDWSDAWKYFKQIISGVGDILLGLGRIILGTVWALIKQIPELIADLAVLVWDAAVWAVTGLASILWSAAKGVWDFFFGLGKTVIGLIVDAATWLWDTGGDILGGLLDGIVEGAKAVWTWIEDLGGAILDLIVGAATWLWDTGSDMLGGLLDGIVEGAKAVWTWFSDLGKTIWNGMSAVWDWMGSIGEKLIGGVWEGIQSIWSGASGIWDFFSNMGKHLWDAMSAVWGWMKSIGSNLLGAIWEGIQSIWGGVSGVWDFFANMGKHLWDAMGNVGGWLFNLGADMMTKLWNGFKSIWNSFADWWHRNVSDVALIGWLIPDLPKFDIAPTTREAGAAAANGGSKNKMHSGGIVPGMGEVQRTLMAGEMVLTSGQQANLFKMLNGDGATMRGDTTSVENKTVIFNGDLSFPNITDPTDASKFIDNLEMLAG
jgi:TP901 family phage tail tape measure protein